MMNSKKCLGSLIDSLGSPVNIRETVERIDIFGHVSSENISKVQAVINEFSQMESEGWAISLYDGESSEVSLDSIKDEGITFIVLKPSVGRLFFASSAGFNSSLDEELLTRASEILVLDSFVGFKTQSFRVLPWDGELLASLPPTEPNSDAIDPRKGVVRDLTGQAVPADPYRWILVGAEGSGETWNAWKNKATKNLATLLVSDVWKEDSLKVSLNGSRKRTFILGDICIEKNAYAQICQAAEWLLVRQDIEARHEVLVRRLAAIVRAPDTGTEVTWLSVLPSILKEALDGARLDHRAYVRSKSADTVKAMAELRKAVGDDVSRIIDRVHRLSTSFVVGLAALATGLGVRLTLLTAKKNNWSTAGTLFCIVVLAITWASIILQRHISSKSLANELRHMRRWHKNVHIALTRSDYKDLALRPILDAVKLYKKTAQFTKHGMWIASFIFLALFIATPHVQQDAQHDTPQQETKVKNTSGAGALPLTSLGIEVKPGTETEITTDNYVIKKEENESEKPIK